ncbi:tripartite tricarboxylate transporter TctB family protein [Sediminicoccus sp. KRV36]|uniref:tripartite tricarboxylate transporter TctB family protein n=1 Tax=Sediminicoccus sp. KRV36 TaxID=3133721 RepID=UPI00200EDF49|nr:tripartite tricarboxylate transporter TctB family protein [Sediminicoccus rosea]UPY34934.1 tripartite tricarboxylate transporter TctB family protein [Sediminicoccus rosea]
MSTRSQRADFLFGLLWSALGLLIAFESWRMPRLEAQHINPYTIPGLVPGMLGLLLVLFGVILALRGWRGAGPELAVNADAAPWRIGLALVLCLGFGLGVLGHGPPFWLAAGIFLFLAVLLFELPERRAAGTLARGVVRAGLVAVIGAAALTFIFQELFLVRLP